VEKTDAAQIVTLAIFIISYILIFSGKLERATAALVGLFVMLSFGYAFGFFTFEEVIQHVDWEVIILLFGMMTYIGYSQKPGFLNT
jgi:Na+/H+ antiporter NhaD/arsenite permease-like protein